MDSIDNRKGMRIKLRTWKSKLDDLTRTMAMRGSKERENVLGNNQDLNMSTSKMSFHIEQFHNEHRAERVSKMKNMEDGLVDIRGQYVLRPRLSWTGLYGKEPWPRERKQWEKV